MTVMRWLPLSAAGLLVVASVVSLIRPAPAAADPGVTLGIGKIVMNEPLRAGGHYPLPQVPVTNSGTVESAYQVVINTIEGQEEMKPDPAWFTIRPQSFRLRPQERQEVTVSLDLPWLLRPGAYFCLIQVGPVVEVQGTGLGVAAAAKLYFTVEHGNILTATLYSVLDALQKRAPWSYLVLAAVVLVSGYPVLGRVFGIKLSVERRK